MSSQQDPPLTPDPAERFRLPDSFAAGGGPVAGNPFPLDDPLHRVWSEATRRAQETVSRLTADELSTRTVYTAARATALIVAKFDAWAERGVSVVWCDRALQHCDQWLVADANSWLEQVARSYAATPPPFPVDSQLMDLRGRLGAQVHVWKAAARRVCADYQAPMSSPSAVASDSSDTVLGENPYLENDPDHQEWTKTNQFLADTLARVHSAFLSALPRTVDATTVVDWLASWAVDYFDAKAKFCVMAIVRDNDAGVDTFGAIVDACRVNTLNALNQRLARLARQAEGLMNAFPGATTCNTEYVSFGEAVKNRLTPEVTERLLERFAYWLVQAGILDRVYDDQQAAREGATSPEPAPAVTAVPEDVAAAKTVLATSPEAASQMVPPASPKGLDDRIPAGEPSPSPVRDPTSAKTWEGVEIRFLSDLKFQAVVNGKVQEPQNYAEVGFGDGRKSYDAPKAAWDTLRKLAESQGVLSSAATAADWGKVEKHIQEIRQRLRACFKLEGDPVPYIDGGYRTRFKIRLSASYER